jgi:type IV secretory pathway TraG/TraD family ATPase VirD4
MSEQALALARWEDQSDVSRKFRFNFTNFWLGRAEDGTALGYSDDRHICLVSGNRGGKGTSVIVNNLSYWGPFRKRTIEHAKEGLGFAGT